MRKFEYSIERHINMHPDAAQQQNYPSLFDWLNMHGEEGSEVVHIEKHVDATYVTFKKEV